MAFNVSVQESSSQGSGVVELAPQIKQVIVIIYLFFRIIK